jgi:hypothetical protein
MDGGQAARRQPVEIVHRRFGITTAQSVRNI